MTSINVNRFEVLRSLGLLEQWSTARHHLGFYNNVGVSISYTADTHVPLKSLVFSALSVVISQHPILSAIPVDEDTQNPYFVRPEINLDQTVRFVHRQQAFDGFTRDKELDELLEVQHNRNFKNEYGSLPFWRLMVVANHPNPGPKIDFVASFIFHHALGDGVSGTTFHESFFSALSESKIDQVPSAIVYPPKTALLPELEKLHGMPLPPMSAVSDRPGLWTGNAIQTPLLSRFQSLVFSKQKTVALVRACREQNTTVTAAIQVIVATALFQAIPEDKSELDCSVPVCLRRWLPEIDKASMGNYIDGLMETYQRRDLEEFSWAEAQRSRGTVLKYIAAGGEFLNVAKIKLISNIIDSFASQVGKERNLSFDVSNLGLVGEASQENAHNCRRGRAVFSRSASVTQAALSVGVVTGGDGCLVLGLVWQEGVVGKSIIESVVKKIEVEIDQITKN